MAESGKSGVRKSPESSKECVTMDNAHRLPEGSTERRPAMDRPGVLGLKRWCDECLRGHFMQPGSLIPPSAIKGTLGS